MKLFLYCEAPIWADLSSHVFLTMGRDCWLSAVKPAYKNQLFSKFMCFLSE